MSVGWQAEWELRRLGRAEVGYTGSPLGRTDAEGEAEVSERMKRQVKGMQAMP